MGSNKARAFSSVVTLECILKSLCIAPRRLATVVAQPNRSWSSTRTRQHAPLRRLLWISNAYEKRQWFRCSKNRTAASHLKDSDMADTRRKGQSNNTFATLSTLQQLGPERLCHGVKSVNHYSRKCIEVVINDPRQMPQCVLFVEFQL